MVTQNNQNPFITSANPQQLTQFQELPPELQSEYKDINRQQRIGDVLTSQAFNQPQGQMVSGRYVAPSFFQNLAPLANAFMGNYASNQADQRQTMLAQKLREGGQKELQTFNDIAQGTPDKAGDLAAALRYAQTAQYSPQLRNIAGELMKPRTMKKEEQFVIPSMSGGKPIVLAEGAPDIPDTIKTAALMVGLGKKDPSTWTPDERALVSARVVANKQAGAANVTTHIANYEPFADAAQKDAAKILGADQTRLEAAPDQIRSLDTVMTTLKNNPTFVGPQGSNMNAIASYANKYFGANIPPDKIADTAYIKKVMTSIATTRLKQSDPNPTEKQMNLMLQTIGSIDTDPNALYKLAEQERNTLANSVARHNARVVEAEKRSKNAFSFDYKVELPKTSTTPAPAGVSQQQWDVMTPDQRKLFGG
jgi:hypothetical protein